MTSPEGANGAEGKPHAPPRLDLLQTRDGVKVYIVDGNHVRTHLEVDFTQSAHCFSFPKLVPADEIWIDREETPDETKYIANHAFIERALMQQGWKYNDALNLADRVARKERGKKRDERFLDKKPNHDELPKRLYVRRLEQMEEAGGVQVWLINGKAVREVLDLEFVQGGHEYVYTYVPANEVWLDDDLIPEELPHVLLHEIVERNLMAKGMSYGRAHYYALRKEKEARLAGVKAEAEKAEGVKKNGKPAEEEKKDAR
ncbi:MAG: hypothetical protein RDV41_06300 [Planctomycetota bacterium]|nr:hypothetical protein [Planctomycetota bacterium]